MKATMTTTTLAALTVALFHTTALAESRIWTDVNGNTIEAELVRVLSQQVVLRGADGRDIKVSLDTLSAADRAAAMFSQPPTIDLKVSAKTSRSNSSLRSAGRGSRVQIEEETTQVKLVATKTSAAPYEAALTATLFVMGTQNGGEPVLIDKVTKDFVYEGKNKEFEMTSDAFESRAHHQGERRAQYAGWLVVVTDSNDEVVASRSSKKEYADHADALMGMDQGGIALTADYQESDVAGHKATLRGRF